jgi:Tfp pilus assembly PilM family ATPase
MAETAKVKSSNGRLQFGGGRRNRVPAQMTALDIDGAVLRVAVGTRRGDRIEFNRIASTPLSIADDADRSDPAILGAAIRHGLNELGFKPGTVAIGVPRRESILRTVSLPDLSDDRELASMVRLQVGRDLPYRKEDAVIDFEPRRESESLAPAPSADADTAAAAPKIEALVAVAQTTVVEFYQKVCAAAGL